MIQLPKMSQKLAIFPGKVHELGVPLQAPQVALPDGAELIRDFQVVQFPAPLLGFWDVHGGPGHLGDGVG